MVGKPPRPLSPPALPVNQQENQSHPQQMNIAITCKNATITTAAFNALQKELFSQISDQFAFNEFTLVCTEATNEEENDNLPKDLMNLYKRHEIFSRGKRECLISIHSVGTTLTLFLICSNANLDEFMTTHQLGLRRHHWSHEEYNIVRPFFVLRVDAQFTLKEDALESLHLLRDFLDKIECIHTRAVPTECSQTIATNLIQAQIFALEVQWRHSSKLISIV